MILECIDSAGKPYGALHRLTATRGEVQAIVCTLLYAERIANVHVEVCMDGEVYRRSEGVMVVGPGRYRWVIDPPIPAAVLAAADFGYRFMHTASDGNVYPVHFTQAERGTP